MVGSGMGTVRVRTEERVHVRELACACSAGAGEYWSKQPFAHLFATKCAANATFYGSGVTLWISIAIFFEVRPIHACTLVPLWHVRPTSGNRRGIALATQGAHSVTAVSCPPDPCKKIRRFPSR